MVAEGESCNHRLAGTRGAKAPQPTGLYIGNNDMHPSAGCTLNGSVSSCSMCVLHHLLVSHQWTMAAGIFSMQNPILCAKVTL